MKQEMLYKIGFGIFAIWETICGSQYIKKLNIIFLKSYCI